MRKFFHAIDQKLLRFSPTLWNNHLLLLLGGTLFLHLIFYVLGYTFSDPIIHSSKKVSSYFFESSYILLYIILVILLLVGFGFRWYTHNPLMRYYPLKKGYLFSVFLYLLCFIYLIGLVPYSFNQGIADAAKSNYRIEDLKERYTRVQNALPFIHILNNQKDYFNIENRSYPKPFPLSVLGYSVLSKSGADVEEAKEGDSASSPRIDSTKPYVTLDERMYQFGTLVHQKDKNDTCNTKPVLKDIKNVNGIYGLALYSVYNYSPQWNYPSLLSDTTEWYRIFHSKLINWDNIDLEEDLNWFIQNELDPDYRNNIDVSVVVSTVLSLSSSTILFSYFDDLEYISTQSMETKYSNYNSAFSNLGYKSFSKEVPWILLIVSIIIALVLLLSKYVPIIPFILSVVLSNVLFFTLMMLLVLLSYAIHSFDEELMIYYTATFYTLLILSISYIQLSKDRNQKRAYYLIVPASTAAIVFPMLVYYIVNKYSFTLDPCTDLRTVAMWTIHSWHMVLLMLLSSFYIFFLIKKTRTIPE